MKVRHSGMARLSLMGLSYKRRSFYHFRVLPEYLRRVIQQSLEIVQLQQLPILGICGTRGSGKTYCIDHTVSRLKDSGLSVAVIRWTADVVSFKDMLADRLLNHDLVLIDVKTDNDINDRFTTIKVEVGRLGFIDKFIDDFLAQQIRQMPAVGCILIGGKSSRMGCPKHLIIKDGKSWLKHTVDTLSPMVDRVLVVGSGEVPEGIAKDVERLADIADCHGPLAGILAAYRKYPWSGMLVCACDLPNLTQDALIWVLSKRNPGAWAVLPQNTKHYEPLLAWYDFRIRTFFEKMLTDKIYKLSNVAYAPNVNIIEPPAEIKQSWCNVNYAYQLRNMKL